MGNSYAVVPNILPGNVSIGGNLTIGGDQLRIGVAAPFVRLGKAVGSVLVLNGNIAFDGVTLDDATKFGFSLSSNLPAGGLAMARYNPAGNFMNGALRQPWLTDYTQHAHTGTVTEDTIYSKVIRAGIIGANGGLRIHALMTDSVQGAPVTTIRFKMGATTFFSTNIGSVISLMWDMRLLNRNSQAVQNVHGTFMNVGTGALFPSVATLAIDTSVDQTFSVTVQNGTATDSQTFEAIVAELINSFGPV